MQNKYLIINKTKIKESNPNVTFLFPLKDYCVGIENVYTIEEIPAGSFIYLNRILDTMAIRSFLSDLKVLQKKIKGIVFEDLGILELIKDKNFVKILYATHALCSTPTVNAYLNFVDSVLISPDITLEETENIITNAIKPCCVVAGGRIPFMYTRRTVLTNFAKNYNFELKQEQELVEKTTNKSFMAIENQYGTVLYGKKFYDAHELLNHPNVLYYFMNLEEVSDDLNSFLTQFEKGSLDDLNTYFLHQKTIYTLPPKEVTK